MVKGSSIAEWSTFKTIKMEPAPTLEQWGYSQWSPRRRVTQNQWFQSWPMAGPPVSPVSLCAAPWPRGHWLVCRSRVSAGWHAGSPPPRSGGKLGQTDTEGSPKMPSGAVERPPEVFTKPLDEGSLQKNGNFNGICHEGGGVSPLTFFKKCFFL